MLAFTALGNYPMRLVEGLRRRRETYSRKNKKIVARIQESIWPKDLIFRSNDSICVG